LLEKPLGIYNPRGFFLTILHFSNRYFGKDAMKNNNKFFGMVASVTLCVAGLLGVTAANAVDTIQTTPVTQGMSQTMSSTSSSQGAMEKCFGVARAGQNDCEVGMDPVTCDKSVIDADPNYWIYVPQGLCNKLVGGMTTPGTMPNTMNTVPATPMTTPSAGSTTTPGTTTDPGMAPSTLPAPAGGVVQ
jgi:uncharacterized membrane protein